jgi:hypothetical protein
MSAETAEAKTTVEAQKRWLVTEGDRIGALAKSNKDWKHQLRTIWEAARLETEPLVVLNLLRYQAARNQGNWHTPVDVYEPLRAAIETCRGTAGDDGELAMELIRHLLAYTYRAFTFYSTEKGGGQ